MQTMKINTYHRGAAATYSQNIISHKFRPLASSTSMHTSRDTHWTVNRWKWKPINERLTGRRVLSVLPVFPGQASTNQHRGRLDDKQTKTDRQPQLKQAWCYGGGCMLMETVQRLSHLCQEQSARATNLPCSRPPSGWCSPTCSAGPGTESVRQTQSPPGSRTHRLERCAGQRRSSLRHIPDIRFTWELWSPEEIP